MRTLLVLLIFILNSVVSFSRTIYVKASATGSNNGASWLHAFTSLTSAINFAGTGDTIKVAAGTYKPGTAQTSIFLIKNGVTVLGGYSVDSTIITRNWALYPTILSGKISATVNSIVLLYGNNITTVTAWDGFILEFAISNSSDYGACKIENNSSLLQLRNLLFRSHTGTVIRCLNSSPQFFNCIVIQNQAQNFKSTVYNQQNSAPKFYNCVFANNAAWDTASVMYNVQSSPTIVNCTFYGNEVGFGGGRTTIVGLNNSNITIGNSIFFFNRTAISSNTNYTLDSFDLVLFNSTASVTNSMMQNYDIGNALKIAENPRFRDTSDLDGPDNSFFTADDGLQLTNPCSPGLNSGDNSLVASLTTDLLGNPRRFNSGTVDIGAYEFQSAPSSVMGTVYVNASATGANNGSSWANAFTDLQKALLYCSDTIKVAAGLYYPSLTGNYKSSFWLSNHRIILGGYPNTGNPDDNSRNPATNLTNLTGKMPLPASPSLLIVKSVYNDSTCVLDGFVIREARGDTSGYTESGGLYINNKSAPVIRNCRISKNVGSYNCSGGVVCQQFSHPLIYNCIIDSNIVGEHGGGTGIYLYSSPRFIKCSLRNNQSALPGNVGDYNGGAVYSSFSNPVFDSCDFTKNIANDFGGAFYNVASNTVISNSTFSGNVAPYRGREIYNEASSPVVTNCKFKDTAYTEFGGKVCNMNNSNPVFRFCEFANASAQTGGAVYNNHSSPHFISCLFINNRSSSDGGVVYNRNYSSPSFINCVGTANNASGAGAFMYSDRSFPEVINCTFSKNAFTIPGTRTVIANYDSSYLTVKNTLFWGNGDYHLDVPGPEIANGGGLNQQPPIYPAFTTISNSITQGYGTNGVNGNMVGINPRMLEYQDADGLDNIFFTADDGFRLTPCSPAINAGANSANTETVDVLNNPRVFNSTIDIGAYEFQLSAGVVPKTYYVNAAATGASDGTSWSNAYTSLWQAINNICADTIKVAAGTYKPAFTARDSSFHLMHGKVYLGGYPAIGNPTDADRNPFLNPVILSGNIGNIGDSTDNARHVVWLDHVDGSVIFDGFYVTGGNAEFVSGQENHGGGVLISGSRGSIVNCTVKKNFAQQGGGIGSDNAVRLRLTKNIITDNRSSNFGAGLYVGSGNDNVIENCVITNNYSPTNGGGLYISAPAQVRNCIFYRNYAEVDGGGMYAQGAITIANCDFVYNLCGPIGRGAGLYNNVGSNPTYPLTTNSIFKGNIFGSTNETYLGGDIYNSNCPSMTCANQLVRYTRVQNYVGGTNNPQTDPAFVNLDDGDGPDDIWMTGDDGLRLQACSPLINYGLNSDIAGVTQDIIGNNRVINGTVDLGAYEFNGSPIGSPVLSTANDSLIANKEFTTADGWTHYYRDCNYILSIRKNGQNIGAIGDGTFQVKVVTTPAYGSGNATNLTNAVYNTSGNFWFTMNSYWNVKATNPVTDSILVRFPYKQRDFNDLKGGNPTLTAHEQIEFFKVANTNYPFDLSVTAPNFFRYTNGPTPSLTNWTLSQADSVFFCDYYVTSFSGGSGGSTFNGQLPDLTITSPISPSSVPTNSAFTVSFTETNNGAASANANKVYFYLSADNLLTPGANGDSFLGEYAIVNSVAAGANTGSLTKDLFMACSLTPGTYYLFFVADGNNFVAESSETNNATSITVTVTAGNNTPATPIITASPGTSACAPSIITLTANSAGCSGCTYTWSNGGSGASIAVNTAGTYTVTVNNGCATASAQQAVTFTPPLNVTISVSASPYCQGQPLTLTATGATTYTWTGPGLSATTGSSVEAILPNSGNVTYNVTGTTNGCSQSKGVLFTVYSRPAINIIQNDTTICSGNSVQLNATFGGFACTWTPAEGLNTTNGATVIATPGVSTMYKASTTNAVGCSNSDSIRIVVSSSLTPSVTISYTGCPGNTLNFTANPVNGGSTPQYQWYVDNVSAGTGNPLILQNATNNMQVYVKMTSTGSCVNPATVNSATTTINCITTAVTDIDGLQSFEVSPNPTTGLVNVKMKLNVVRKVSFSVMDGTGKEVYKSSPETMSGTINRQLAVGTAGGIYYLKTTFGNQVLVSKIVRVP